MSGHDSGQVDSQVTTAVCTRHAAVLQEQRYTQQHTPQRGLDSKHLYFLPLVSGTVGGWGLGAIHFAMPVHC